MAQERDWREGDVFAAFVVVYDRFICTRWGWKKNMAHNAQKKKVDVPWKREAEGRDRIFEIVQKSKRKELFIHIQEEKSLCRRGEDKKVFEWVGKSRLEAAANSDLRRTVLKHKRTSQRLN
jgi:hypothetical protein